MKLKLPRASITVRLLSSLLVASLAPLIVVGIISYHTARSIIQDEVSSYTQQIISEQRDYLDLMLDEVEGLIGNVSKLEDVGDIAVSQDARISDETSLRIQTEIEGILKGYTHLRGRVSVDIFAPDGERIHAGDIPGLPATGTAEVSRLYADTLASHLAVYWAGFFPYSQTGAGNAPAITAASVLHPFGSGAAGGTLLLVNFSVDCLYDHFAGSNSGDGGYLAIIDDDGRIIFHPDRMRIGGQFGGDFGHWFTADHGSFVGAVDGRTQFVTYSRSAVSGWTLLSFVPVERLAASTSRISRVTILVGSVFASLILLLALAMSRDHRPDQPDHRAVQAATGRRHRSGDPARTGPERRDRRPDLLVQCVSRQPGGQAAGRAGRARAAHPGRSLARHSRGADQHAQLR